MLVLMTVAPRFDPMVRSVVLRFFILVLTTTRLQLNVLSIVGLQGKFKIHNSYCLS